MKIVSACLVGLKTRYDGCSQTEESCVELLVSGKAIPLCPEQLGGLPTPRKRAEISDSDGNAVLSGDALVISEDGEDYTEHFIRGAEEVLKIALLVGSEEAILKEGSPSCGVGYIKRNGKKVKGMGVTAALLKSRGIKVRGQ